MNIVVTTTFPNDAWDVYAKKMLTSFVANWPADVPLCVELDNDLLLADVQKIVRPTDAIAVGWNKDHIAFVERNKGKDDPQNYRRQPVRFCHKVFSILRVYMATVEQQRQEGNASRYIVWLDADVVTNRKVTMEELLLSFPKEGDAVSYMGRKDWPHSECGWMVFDLDNGGDKVIMDLAEKYVTDEVLAMKEQHDSWVFDQIRPENSTNLTPEAKGMDVWPQSPMGQWSTHYKGPQAKAELFKEKPMQQQIPIGNQGNVVIQTRNAVPHEKIRSNIAENQRLIKNWVVPCLQNDETIVVASAGPMLIAEDLLPEVEAGRRIVAVKHALEPLKNAGIKPWACILLDPRPHVNDFVQSPDTDVIWFVASQVDPIVVKTLRTAGCTIWGYHAAVGADEGDLTKEQPFSIISGGTATATRGLHVLNHLGFSDFRLYGYDLCIFDKPNMNEKDAQGQPKYLEISIGFNDKALNHKKCFWTKPELVAQFEELNDLIKNDTFKIEAFGEGIVPFIVKSKRVANLRNGQFKGKLGRLLPYGELLGCSNRTWQDSLPKWLPRIHLRRMPDAKY